MQGELLLLLVFSKVTCVFSRLVVMGLTEYDAGTDQFVSVSLICEVMHGYSHY
jgi:hypothetical protein